MGREDRKGEWEGRMERWAGAVKVRDGIENIDRA